MTPHSLAAGLLVLTAACAPTGPLASPRTDAPSPSAITPTKALPERLTIGPDRAVRLVRSIPARVSPALEVDAIDVSSWTFEPAQLILDSGSVSCATPSDDGCRLWKPFLAQIHNKLHPIFVDQFIASLESSGKLPFPGPEPRGGVLLYVRVARVSGNLEALGIARSSGSELFDVAALESIARASPFSVPPDLEGPDHPIQFFWEFFRDPAIACTTFNVRVVGFSMADVRPAYGR